MAKLNAITLTPAGVFTELKDETGALRSVRGVELEVLEALAVVAANNQEDHCKLNVCFDLIAEIKAITDEMGIVQDVAV